MKNFKLIIFTLIATTTMAFSQVGDPNLSGKVVLTELTKDILNTDENITYNTQHLQITEEYTPVILDPKDKYKLNQDIIFMPTQVTKKIILDNDSDILYDKRVKISYTKPDNFDLDFTLTKDGIIVLTDKKGIYISKIWDKNSKVTFSNNKKNRINTEGTYTIQLTNKKEVDITINNYVTYK